MSDQPERRRPKRPNLTTSATTSGHRSDCPICRRGIWAGDKTVWISRPVTGTVHEHCAPKEET